MTEVDICIVGSMADADISIEVSIPSAGMDIWAKAAPARRAEAMMLLNNIFWLNDSNSCKAKMI